MRFEIAGHVKSVTEDVEAGAEVEIRVVGRMGPAPQEPDLVRIRTYNGRGFLPGEEVRLTLESWPPEREPDKSSE